MTLPAPVDTGRFELVSLSEPALEALARDDPSEASAHIGASVPDCWHPGADGTFNVQLSRLREQPDSHRCLMRAIVRRADRTMVGYIGFHGPPGMPHLDELAPGGVEMGYTVLEQYRGDGVATEAAEVLMQWAAEAGAPAIVLSIAPDNAASLRIADKLGFARAGQWEDEEDGTEFVFVRRSS